LERFAPRAVARRSRTNNAELTQE